MRDKRLANTETNIIRRYRLPPALLRLEYIPNAVVNNGEVTLQLGVGGISRGKCSGGRQIPAI